MAFRKYTLNENAFNEITEESAYWVGFLMADGCIYKKTVRLYLSEKDINHIEKFRCFLGASHPIKVVGNNKKLGDFISTGIDFYSEKITKRLAEYGVIPQKSKTAKVIELENNRHFWRGVIDGDGSLCLDKRFNAASISLIGSKSLCEQFFGFVNKVGVLKSKAKVATIKGSNAYSIVIGGFKAAEIISELYQDSIVSLERKHFKALEIIGLYKEKALAQNEHQKKIETIVNLYQAGSSAPKISKIVEIHQNSVYEILERLGIERRYKTRQATTGKRYMLNGKCKDCGKDTVPNRSRCEFHLAKARNWWRKKHGQERHYRI